MLPILQDKSVIFFDLGYTLLAPASGDWMLTLRFRKEAGNALKLRSEGEIRRALETGFRFLAKNHRITTTQQELRQFEAYYALLSEELGLGLSASQLEQIARDRTFNMDNYLPDPQAHEVLETLSRTHRLGVISDTWPSTGIQLETFGLSRFFSWVTFSCDLGIMKPDPRIYLDALHKSGVPARETAFIDDNSANLDGASALGITPILIAPHPASGEEGPFFRIRALKELLQEAGAR